MRSREEMRSLHKKRLRDLENEARNDVLPDHPCMSCRWKYGGSRLFGRCEHPLIKGFSKSPQWIIDASDGVVSQTALELCGRDERALWEPRPSLVQRFIEWFLAPWQT